MLEAQGVQLGIFTKVNVCAEPYVKEFLSLGAHDKALMPSSHSGRLHLTCNQVPQGHVSSNLTDGSIREEYRLESCSKIGYTTRFVDLVYRI